MFDFLIIGLALRFLVFDYTYSPVQRYLSTATNPILVTLFHCSFCQGSEIGFILQIYDLFHGVSIVDVFLKAITVGYTSFVVGQLLDGGDRGAIDAYDFDIVDVDDIASINDENI